MALKPPRLADASSGAATTGGSNDIPLSQLPGKGRVACRGRIESVTYVPLDQAAAFSAMVSDDVPGRKPVTAASRRHLLRVVWLGRRRVPGIAAGTEVHLEGMLSHVDGMPTMFNPRYELLTRQENE